MRYSHYYFGPVYFDFVLYSPHDPNYITPVYQELHSIQRAILTTQHSSVCRIWACMFVNSMIYRRSHNRRIESIQWVDILLASS